MGQYRRADESGEASCPLDVLAIQTGRQPSRPLSSSVRPLRTAANALRADRSNQQIRMV